MTVRLPPPTRPPRPEPAYDYISEATRQSPGELTLVALGPLTNVARVVRRDPGVAERLKRLVVMGGAVESPGNVTPYAEFNTYNDPEAAQVVFSSGMPVTLVGLDVCDRVLITSDDDRWARGGSPAERLARRLTDGWFALHDAGARYTPCDAMAVLAVTNPELMSFRQASVRVETEDKEKPAGADGRGVRHRQRAGRDGHPRRGGPRGDRENAGGELTSVNFSRHPLSASAGPAVLTYDLRSLFE